MYEATALKLNILQIIPVHGYWNVYINEETQTEQRVPVTCLALIQEEGRQKLKYIDILHISAQEENPDAFESLTFMHTDHDSSLPIDGLED